MIECGHRKPDAPFSPTFDLRIRQSLRRDLLPARQIIEAVEPKELEKPGRREVPRGPRRRLRPLDPQQLPAHQFRRMAPLVRPRSRVTSSLVSGWL